MLWVLMMLLLLMLKKVPREFTFGIWAEIMQLAYRIILFSLIKWVIPLKKSYCQRNQVVILKREKDYYENDKERLRKQARDKYRNLFEEEKSKKREYGKNRYHNMSKKKKQELKKY